ncbi:3-oxoacyl-[acyl-carrier-protein] reductase FabG [Fundidesulfovibrio magnetotacticus]|uniref:3-oxoacyl-[acyl-carrier-protein] reductase FabG n=1 Tax=Fundidesulfovibrio magnetotacticus TaxID=2730080 RepID=A0A6V8LSG1_9BACT|nr:SDR family NAD(P)-dependent oxidoreductase [Fundidesulfovibrio magnetotacticus]GFK92726.1 3-oxoacyl-[acyl-carrier-protein] reductase FabG [Fundidesulfovibrio magnetotacticus]
MLLKDKTLIITGASMGVGRALAEALAVLGSRLVLNARGAEDLEDAWHACDMVGAQAVAVPGDASKATTARALLEAAQSLGDFVGFVHCAGVLNPGPHVWEMDCAGFDEVFSSNVKGGWILARHCVPVLRKAGSGLAVFVGSGAASVVQPGMGLYCAAKAAEEHLCRQLAAEAPWLTCFVYRPGLVDTRMQHQARNALGGGAEALRALFRPWKERGRLIMPEESAMGLMRLLLGEWKDLSGHTFDMRDSDAPVF